MANIILTYKCNLKCSYCFANEFVNKSNEEITIDNFKLALEFIKKDGSKKLGLIGGEPTLHPDFKEILNILKKDKSIENVVIYTNGTYIDKFVDDIKDKKFKLLINCNSQELIGEQYHILCRNLDLLSKKFKPKENKFVLGINLYSPDMSYSYIIDLLKKHKLKMLRFSMIAPNQDKSSKSNVLGHCEQMHSIVFSLLNDLYSQKIIPVYDCNQFPICLHSDEDKKLIDSIVQLARKSKIYTNVDQEVSTCKPVVDILPNLTAVRCFGLSNYAKVPIYDFKNLRELKRYFFNLFDVLGQNICFDLNCVDCRNRQISRCGVCLVYKMIDIIKVREYTKNLVNRQFKF